MGVSIRLGDCKASRQFTRSHHSRRRSNTAVSVVGMSIPRYHQLLALAAGICASTKAIPRTPISKERWRVHAESMRALSGNPTSGANQHPVAPAAASFQDEAASILLHLLPLQVRLQMPRETYPAYGRELSLQ
jgi:hypothetical protein